MQMGWVRALPVSALQHRGTVLSLSAGSVLRSGRGAFVRWGMGVAAVLGLSGICSWASPSWTTYPSQTRHTPARIRLEQEGARPGVRLIGIARGLEGTPRERMQALPWREIFRIRVAEPGSDPTADSQLPAVLGTYRLEQDDLLFTPRFPFRPGLRLQASFDPRPLGPVLLNRLGTDFSKPLEVSLEISAGRIRPRAQVARIYPSASRLPENLLKVYLHFTHSMSSGLARRYVRLVDRTGREVELPFLELDHELWDPEQRRLTLFFDPGRIKRGLLPNQRVGTPLRKGERYRLEVDAAWPDADGVPLKRGFSKDFSVGPPDRHPPDPEGWKLQPPQSGTSQALVIRFPEPLDHALLERLIWVVGPDSGVVAGRVTVSDQERAWELVPEVAWKPGEYRIAVGTVLEDVAGNTLNAPFEVDVFETVQERLTSPVYHLEFRLDESVSGRQD